MNAKYIVIACAAPMTSFAESKSERRNLLAVDFSRR